MESNLVAQFTGKRIAIGTDCNMELTGTVEGVYKTHVRLSISYNGKLEFAIIPLAKICYLRTAEKV